MTHFEGSARRQGCPYSQTNQTPIDAGTEIPDIDALSYVSFMTKAVRNVSDADSFRVLQKVVPPLVNRRAMELSSESLLSSFDISSATDLPRSHLKALSAIIHRHGLSDLTPEHLAHANPVEQLRSLTRNETNEIAAQACEVTWRYIKPFLMDGLLPVPCQRFPALNCERTVLGKQDVYLLPLDGTFNKIVGATNIFDIVSSFKSLFSFVAVIAIRCAWEEISSLDGYQRADSILALASPRINQRFSLHEALMAGMGSAAQVSLETLTTLVKLAKHTGSLKNLTAQSIELMMGEHTRFLLQLTGWGFGQFAVLDRILRDESGGRAPKGLSQLVVGCTQDEIQYLVNHSKRYHTTFFRSVEIRDSEGNVVPTLDFNLAAFSKSQLRELSVTSYRMGCPASAVNKEFLPWITDTFKKIALEPILNAPR